MTAGPVFTTAGTATASNSFHVELPQNGTWSPVPQTPAQPQVADIDAEFLQINRHSHPSVVIIKYLWWLDRIDYPHNGPSVNLFCNDHDLGTAYKEYLSSHNRDWLSNEALSSGINPSLVLKSQIDKVMEMPDIPINDLPVKRRVSQPRFKLDYDTIDDAHRRLSDSIIYVGNMPVFVRELYKGTDDIILVVENAMKKVGKILYKKTGSIDLRTPEPQYLTMYGKALRLFRPPARQQSQGLRYDNSFLIRAGSKQTERWENTHTILKALLKSDQTVLWDNTYNSLFLDIGNIRNMRLSGNVAAYLDDETEDNIIIEYKGRKLGELKNKTVYVDRNDFQQPWIKRDLQNVGLKTEVSNAAS